MAYNESTKVNDAGTTRYRQGNKAKNNLYLTDGLPGGSDGK